MGVTPHDTASMQAKPCPICGSDRQLPPHGGQHIEAVFSSPPYYQTRTKMPQILRMLGEELHVRDDCQENTIERG